MACVIVDEEKHARDRECDKKPVLCFHCLTNLLVMQHCRSGQHRL